MFKLISFFEHGISHGDDAIPYGDNTMVEYPYTMKNHQMPDLSKYKDKKILLYFPILHTEKDLGQMGPSVRKLSLQRMGVEGVKKKEAIVDALWRQIEHYFKIIRTSFEQMYLFQDGLPVCGKEEKIVVDLAQSGSRNHQLLMNLMKQGAKLMGTESADLLLKEYQLMQQLIESLNKGQSPASIDHQPEKAPSLLNQRDDFIAQRINQTLKKGLIGVLFLGMLHDITPYLMGDIHVHYPLNKVVKG